MGVGNVAVLAVKVLGDSKGAQQALVDTALASDKASKAVKSSSAVMMGAWAAAAAAAAVCVREATALEQATSAVNQVFGDTAPLVMEWAEGMAEYGLSTAQAAQAAAILGGALKSAGIEMEAVAVLSTKLIEISLDLVATFGYSVPQALSAMAAALRAEYDPLEKFGIYLTADMVQAEKLRLEMEGVTFESERQAKMIATLSLIYQQSIPYMGAAETMQDNLKLTTMRLTAETKNLAAMLGGPLIAVLQPVIDVMGKYIGKVADAVEESELMVAVTDALTALLDAMAPVIESILIPALERMESIMTKLADLIDTYVMPVIDALEKAFDKLADAIDRVIGIVNNAIDAFNNLIGTIHDAIDSLTFWNDTYQKSEPLSSAPPPPEARGRAGIGTHANPTVVNLTINAPAMADPYALAKLVTKSLTDYANVQGRPVNRPPAVAW